MNASTAPSPSSASRPSHDTSGYTPAKSRSSAPNATVASARRAPFARICVYTRDMPRSSARRAEPASSTTAVSRNMKPNAKRPQRPPPPQPQLSSCLHHPHPPMPFTCLYTPLHSHTQPTTHRSGPMLSHQWWRRHLTFRFPERRLGLEQPFHSQPPHLPQPPHRQPCRLQTKK